VDTVKKGTDGMRATPKAMANQVASTTTKPHDVCSLLELVRKTAENQGGMSAVAKKTGLSREALYRALSSNGNPTIKTLSSVLGAIGMNIIVAPISEESMDDETT